MLKSLLRTTEAYTDLLADMGIYTPQDLLEYFPRAHVDLTDIAQITDLQVGPSRTVGGVLVSLTTSRTRTGKWLTRGRLTTRGAPGGELAPSIDLTWFNQPFVTRMLRSGDEVVVTGAVKQMGRRHQMLVNSFEKVGDDMLHLGRVVPVYRSHGKVTSHWLREKISKILPLATQLPELIPPHICAAHSLMPRAHAITQIHFPTSSDQEQAARRTLAFEELFLLHIAALERKIDWKITSGTKGHAIPLDEEQVRTFTSSLPFAFTRAQKLASYEILQDMSSKAPMLRLLEGDVGSGKTVVAALAIYMTVQAGQQAAVLAPTEILAQQHFRNFLKVLHPLGIRVELLTGSTTARNRKDICARMAAGQLDVLVGTHALLEERVQFQSLALAVIDEQHRFGVQQRQLLKKEGHPHVLNMTATPIPRTLALTIFGDQEVSILDELPPGRQEILTRIVPADKRSDAERWTDDQIEKGRQVFVVCPLVDDSDTLDAKSVKAEYERLQQTIFAHRRIGLLHGKMKPKEKEAVMSEFASGQLHILVSTSVIEVGIDVPNASIMLIEGAERFGLAQLHQFRGRVGRGEHKSYCFLFPTDPDSMISERLHALEVERSGFKLAEIDLKLRGPGEVFGTRQSGIPDMKIASLTDRELMQQSRTAAEALLASDAHLISYPALREAVTRVAARQVGE